jgi:hypothetical protein
MRSGTPTQVILEGKGPATLRPADHIATGGEGSIYKVAGMAVKMYLKPEEQRAAGLPEKIKLLSKLAHPYVGAPKGLVLNSAHEPVGHYLPFVEGHALSLVFTRDFWMKESFDQAKSSTLVGRIREAVEFAHANAAIMVDANELNWFAVLNGSGPEPRVIDVDSWAIGKWPASVIMPSIRDWNSKAFDEKSDWFAWGIVTFQIYTGIHPYKGTLVGFDRTDLVGRMKANASVFSPGIRLNIAVRDFATIPGPLRSWYEATFQKGERTKPPSPSDKDLTAPAAIRTSRTVVVSGAGLLAFEKIFSLATVTRTFSCGVVQDTSGALWDLASRPAQDGFRPVIGLADKDCAVVRTGRGWLVGHKNGFTHVGSDLQAEKISLQVTFRSLLTYENRMFAVTESGLSEIVIQNFGSRAVASVSNTWGIMVNSTRWFSGVGVLDAMGAMFLIVPFGKDSVAQLRIKELDGLRVLAGAAGNRFVSLVAIDRQGEYHKLEFTFDREYTQPPKIWQGKTDSAELNLAILPKGVCATIVKDGELDIFVPSNGAVKRIEDKQIATDMALSNWGDTVIFVQSGNVWTLKVK